MPGRGSLHGPESVPFSSCQAGADNPAIFWPCKEGSLPPPRRVVPSAEVFELRTETRDFNAWLRAELDARFQDVERKLSELDRCSLQEQLLVQMNDTDRRLEAIASQLARCEASLSAMHCAQDTRVGSKPTSVSSEYEATMPQLSGRGRVRSIEELSSFAPFQGTNPFQEKVSIFFDDPDSSLGAYWFAALWPQFVFTTALFTLAETLPQTYWRGTKVVVCEVFIDVIFGIELIMRYMGCPSTLGFVRNPHNIFDFAAALPIVMRAVLGFRHPDEQGIIRFCLLCVVPLLRLLKMLRWLKQFYLFARVLEDTKEALKFLLFMLFIIVLLFSSLFYLVEPSTNVVSVPQAMWFTVITVTTVGYTPPESEAGHIVLVFLLLVSVLYMAMPIGILGNAFTEVWKDRDLILLASKTRERLGEWGYTPKDIPTIFRVFDTDGNGELTVMDFRQLLSAMRIGLSDDRVVELFNLLDKDDGGGVDHKEFLKRLFPSTYYELYGSRRGKGPHARRSDRRMITSESAVSKSDSRMSKKVSRKETKKQTKKAQLADSTDSLGALQSGWALNLQAFKTGVSPVDPQKEIGASCQSTAASNAADDERPDDQC